MEVRSIWQRNRRGKDDLLVPILPFQLADDISRLSSILSKRSLSAQKLDEIKIKHNILSAFKRAEEKLEEVVEEAEDAIKRATAEL